jgi:L-Lysine epsilon oxidase N-terminal/L-lysine epsilon oxidase C-terminal domain
MSDSGSNSPSASEKTNDSGAKLQQMFVDIVGARRIALGQVPAQRPVFRKTHGVAHGRFEILPNLPSELRVGVFAKPRSFPLWARFSSDTGPADTDLKSTCGIGIKLFDVEGKKLLGDGTTHDFLLQNSDVFFVDTADDMAAFTAAGVIGGNYEPYLKEHPTTARILNEMEKVVDSVLTTSYWSGLPYLLGKGHYVKYKLEPEQKAGTQPGDDPNYLAQDLASRLRAGEACFRFMLQLRTDPATMPLDAATVRWEESQSMPIAVARLILPVQDVCALGQAEYGENLAFNPWHCLPEHQPEGSISAVRRRVYAASAEMRHDVNGVPNREPGCPRGARALPVLEDTTVVSAAIYPAIGVARVGNSQDEFFLGPEVAEPSSEAWGFYRDATGALKRQACRFRVYGMNSEGKPVCELNAANAEVHWTAHLVNKKSAWYQFQLAQDIPEAASAPPSLLRNATVTDRKSLIIDPGPRHIHGTGKHSHTSHQFDTGEFVGKQVYLGELRTDEAGRLIVLGGRGVSASFDGSRAVTFANNEAWHDDTSDGPVTAKVTFEGKELKVKPAWVIVAPPNYAPQQKSIRTMWDLMRDVAISNNMLPAVARPSFCRDIQPIFERLSRLQWVNKGFANAFGWKGWRNLSTPEQLERLGRNDPSDSEWRLTIANEFRVLSRDSFAAQPLPWNYGDAMNIPPADTPRQNAALTDTQLHMLQQWAYGDFEADYDASAKQPRTLDEVPVPEQPDMLDRASMEFCLADAFHPGCEMTWPMRSATLYMGPFRVLHNKQGWVEPSFGAELIQDTLSLPNGPLAAQSAGDLTRWMAVPWQTDTASCRSGYMKSYDPYLPAFWPARVPNQVLTHENYEIVMDGKRPLAERMAAFANRAAWVRPLGDKTYTDQINNMIREFGDLGVVEEIPGPLDADFPSVMGVENRPSRKRKNNLMAERTPSGGAMGVAENPIDTVDLTGIEKVRRFPRGLRRD